MQVEYRILRFHIKLWNRWIYTEKEASFQSDDETSFQLNLCVYYILFYLSGISSCIGQTGLACYLVGGCTSAEIS